MDIYTELFAAETQQAALEAQLVALRQRIGYLKLLMAIFSDLPID